MLDLRTRVAGTDPGLARLRLASIAVLAIGLAVSVAALVRAVFAPTEPVTVLMFAGVLTMISNLAVNEPDLPRRRATTVLMLLPAWASTTAGALLSPHRLVADVVFVAVMVVAVWVRRYGPRGFALGMAAFMPFFFTQFLQAQPAQLPWLLVSVTAGIGSTLLLRGVVFAERPERTLRRLVAAFRGRTHGVLLAVDHVLVEVDDPRDMVRALDRAHRAGRRVNETALQVEDQLEQTTAHRVWPGLDDETLAMRMFDAELAVERIVVSLRRVVAPYGEPDPARRPSPRQVAALRAGIAHLLVALAPGTVHDEILRRSAAARRAVAPVVDDTASVRDDVQRVGFAVRRLADAVEHAQRDAPARPRDTPAAPGPRDSAPEHHTSDRAPRDRATHDGGSDEEAGDEGEAHGDDVGFPAPGRPGDDHGPAADADLEPAPAPGTAPHDGDRAEAPREEHGSGISLSTRQAVQVGVSSSLAIAIGEWQLPTRWYWAVIASFVVFANTSSRGDLLTRGWGRLAGTVGGVVAGMLLALLVSGHQLLSLVTMGVCMFLAIYLVRISPGLLAFWITATLALVYGLIGKFSVQVLVLRIEETALGVVTSVLAAFLVLPRGTRDEFRDALDGFVDAADDVLAASIERLLGQHPDRSPITLARTMDEALATLRARARPLTPPRGVDRRRSRSGYQRGLRVMNACDHYIRGLARLGETVREPSWSSTLRPAAEQVRGNLDGLRDVLVHGHRRSDREVVRARPAERAVDAAEEHAARVTDRRRRVDMLTVTRLLRRVDQAAVALARDLGAVDDAADDGQGPRSSERARLAKTRSGS